MSCRHLRHKQLLLLFLQSLQLLLSLLLKSFLLHLQLALKFSLSPKNTSTQTDILNMKKLAI